MTNFTEKQERALKTLLDDDGENRAVRFFLLGYKGGICDAKDMQRHLEFSGYPFAPDWIDDAPGYLTKAGAQLWLRLLFGLEQYVSPPLTGACHKCNCEPGKDCRTDLIDSLRKSENGHEI